MRFCHPGFLKKKKKKKGTVSSIFLNQLTELTKDIAPLRLHDKTHSSPCKHHNRVLFFVEVWSLRLPPPGNLSETQIFSPLTAAHLPALSFALTSPTHNVSSRRLFSWLTSFSATDLPQAQFGDPGRFSEVWVLKVGNAQGKGVWVICS